MVHGRPVPGAADRLRARRPHPQIDGTPLRVATGDVRLHIAGRL